MTESHTHLRVHMRLHWRDLDLGIHLLLLITEIAPEPLDSRALQLVSNCSRLPCWEDWFTWWRSHSPGGNGMTSDKKHVLLPLGNKG